MILIIQLEFLYFLSSWIYFFFYSNFVSLLTFKIAVCFALRLPVASSASSLTVGNDGSDFMSDIIHVLSILFLPLNFLVMDSLFCLPL